MSTYRSINRQPAVCEDISANFAVVGTVDDFYLQKLKPNTICIFKKYLLTLQTLQK
jgi:hypothetical protein